MHIHTINFCRKKCSLISTCTGTDDNLRLVVMARKVREGENQLDLNMEVMSTYDR